MRMVYPVLFAAVLHVVMLSHLVSSTSPDPQSRKATEEHLLRVKKNIEAHFRKTEGMAHFSAPHQYMREKPWGNYSEGLPVLIHHRVGHWTEWGNYAGIYFEAIACQALTKMHYLAVNEW
jgi:hypothetical protein